MKLVLIGDSIRMGYQDLVRGKVGDRAVVWSPAENCGNSLMHRQNLDAWYLAPQADVIHFNCGIWDCIPMEQDGEPAFSLGEYLRNLELILRRIKRGSKARLIWAATTPCLAPRDETPKQRCSVHPNFPRYNAAAAELMAAAGVEVNDLYRAIMDAGVCDCLQDDKAHMAPLGNEALSDAVVRYIFG